MQFSRLLALAYLLVLSCIAASCTKHSEPQETVSRTGSPSSSLIELSLEVLAAYPHDPSAYTQGLVYDRGKVYESRGLYGKSSIARLNLNQKKAEAESPLDKVLFGEGLALVNDELIQLTWKSGKVFRYAIDTLELNKTQQIQGEGWGLTVFNDQLINSDGSSTLYFRDPSSLAILNKLPVTMLGRPLSKLNELETIEGLIAANVFQSSSIVFIDPDNGVVLARLDLAPLLKRERQLGQVDVVNGIAYRPEMQTLLVTGKLWHHIYEIRLPAELAKRSKHKL